jgi:FkbM family methyltransferase
VHDTVDAHISPTITRTGTWEPLTTRLLLSLAGPGDGVLDIGANIGWYACVLGRAVGPSGFVQCFEPDPLNASVLRSNVSGPEFRHVTIHEVALAERSGESLTLVRSEQNLGDHRLGVDGEEGVVVASVSLDDVLRSAGIAPADIRIVKIDTQGAEGLILRGASSLMDSLGTNTWMVVEFAPNLLAKHGCGEVDWVIDRLVSLGRPMFRLRRSSMLPTNAADLHRLADRLRGHGDEWAVDVLVTPPRVAQTRAERHLVASWRVPRPLRFV